MNVTIENEKENLVKMDITIPAADAQKAYDIAVKRIAQYVNISGFRKGKAPKVVVERHVGTERIKQEAIESLMPNTMATVIKENDLDLITQPYITDYTFNVGEDLKVVAKAEKRPEVTLGDYKDMTVKVEEDEIPAEAFDEALNNLLKQHATMVDVTDRSATKDDVVVIDFEGYVDGEKLPGGESKNYPLDLSRSNFIPGFAEQLVGKSAGEEFDIQVTFPENYHDSSLNGKPATFKIKLNKVQERKLPELTDEFVAKVGPFKTVDELKADIQKYLDNQHAQNNKINSENEVFKKVVDAAKVDITESMIDREVASMKREYETRLQAQGLTLQSVIDAQGEENFNKSLKEDATTRIKNSLVIDKIAKVEKITLEQKDIETKFAELGRAYGLKASDLIKQLSGNPNALTSLSQQAVNDKVRDYLMNSNKVEFVKKSK